jgi:radical SAM family uncharacterized protein
MRSINHTPNSITHALNRILPDVEKPGRYTGGEYNSVVKDWGAVDFRAALAFPEVYQLGASNFGLLILYDAVNRRPDLLAERVFSPWGDMEAAMRAEGLPLFTLESRRAIADFDLFAISLGYEKLYTNALNLIDLAGLPLRAADRTAQHPIVIAGGHGTFNPEPMAPFFDAFVIGEGEEAILDVIDALKAAPKDRDAQRHALAAVPGVYVPALYDVHYADDGTLAAITPNAPEAPARVDKRVVSKMPPPVTRFLVPNIGTVHDRGVVEIMRGCTRGCRFCQAGMIARPIRERPIAEIVDAIDAIITQTGYEEIGLLSLSSSDYGRMHDDRSIASLIEAIQARFADRQLTISLPSLRIETSSVDLVEALQKSTRGGFTIAPEAASEHVKRAINKPIPRDDVLETAREAFRRGWRTLKLYFMIGLPGETPEDVAAIPDLVRDVLNEGWKFHKKAANINVSVGTFVPKPHTPFQWAALEPPESIENKQEIIREGTRSRRIRLNWTGYDETWLEALLGRGDRRLADVIEAAWRRGARFDAWDDHFNPEIWRAACADAGIDPDFYTLRERAGDEILPWDHINAGVSKRFLRREWERARRGETLSDCRETCHGCGLIPTFAHLAAEDWFCPQDTAETTA